MFGMSSISHLHQPSVAGLDVNSSFLHNFRENLYHVTTYLFCKPDAFKVFATSFRSPQSKSRSDRVVETDKMGKQAPALFEQLGKGLGGGEGQDLVKKIKVGLKNISFLFKISLNMNSIT